jgi:hypothetical protein
LRAARASAGAIVLVQLDTTRYDLDIGFANHPDKQKLKTHDELKRRLEKEFDIAKVYAAVQCST